jgi:hypothetical protein
MNMMMSLRAKGSSKMKFDLTQVPSKKWQLDALERMSGMSQKRIINLFRNNDTGRTLAMDIWNKLEDWQKQDVKEYIVEYED